MMRCRCEREAFDAIDARAVAAAANNIVEQRRFFVLRRVKYANNVG